MSVRVIGDRQTGKTEMLLAFAEKLCREGQRVLYMTRDRKLAQNCFRRVEESVYDLPGFRAYRTNGQERVTHESGGELRFMTVAREPRGLTVNTLILDDVDPVYANIYAPVLSTLPDSHLVMATL